MNSPAIHTRSLQIAATSAFLCYSSVLVAQSPDAVDETSDDVETASEDRDATDASQHAAPDVPPSDGTDQEETTREDEPPPSGGEIDDDDAYAEDEFEGEFDEDDQELSEEDTSATILGRVANAKRIAGSAHRISNKELEKLEYDDIHRVLKQVPGVYVRDEDGFGLRPNIGLRGANSDRSAKVTLMEDGILLGPAPYSAPAAYYFPLSTRMYGVEIFKGPASIKHGPNTIGGAINLQTRPVPSYTKGAIDVGLGSYGTGKAHAFIGTGTEHLGLLIEGVRLQSDGFKQLANNRETGFDRTDLMLKGRLNTSYDAAVYQALEIKLGYGNETSHETYLGLSDEDFARMPAQRYAASQNDLMQWNRTQLQARYRLSWEDSVEFHVTGYRHDFDRSWYRLNRFRNGPSIAQVLANPDAGQLAIYHRILKGNLDTDQANQYLMMVNNQRSFVSQGLQGVFRLGFDIWKIRQDLEFGARLHQDQIDRHHLEDAYAMQSGIMVPVSGYDNLATDNFASTLAGAFYAYDEISFGGLMIAPGIRFELIYSSFDDELNNVEDDAFRFAWLPGIGISYQPLDFINLLGGIHKGFSPVAPGQPSDLKAEESINYEGGLRLNFAHLKGELVGFFNQYSNLNGECTFSQGCSVDELDNQFNAGAVNVYGLESSLHHGLRVGSIRYQVDLTYTLSQSQFLSDFSSPNPQYGNVQAGDALPYIPTHQAAAVFGLYGQTFDVTTSFTYASAMRDMAGSGELIPEESTDPYYLVDVMTTYHFTEQSHLYFRVDNLFNQAYVSSRRPFGVRPGKPLQFMIGYKHSVEGL